MKNSIDLYQYGHFSLRAHLIKLRIRISELEEERVNF